MGSEALTYRDANKENVRSEGYQDIAHSKDSGHAESRLRGRLSPPETGYSSFAIKARSSLAASIYQARGQLSQFDGAGDLLHISSSRSRNGSVAPASDRTANASRQPPSAPTTATLARREQARNYDVGSINDFDYRGVTKDVFNARSKEPMHFGAHYNSVDHYFETLRQQEREENATQLQHHT